MRPVLAALAALAVFVLSNGALANAPAIAREARLDQIISDARALRGKLASAQSRLEAVDRAAAKLHNDIGRLRDWGVAQQAAKDDALVMLAETERQLSAARAAHETTRDRYRRLKLTASLIVGAAICVLALRVTPFLPPPHNWLIPGGAAAAGFGLAFLLL